MKITKIDILHVKTTHKNGHWRPILCRIYTDEGIYGDGEAALAYGEAQFAAAGMVRNFAKLIIGMDPLKNEVIWDRLYRGTFWGQNGGPVVFAGISAIDMALWDIKGKYYNAPVHELLGGKRRDNIRTYASQLQFGWENDIVPCYTPEMMADSARKAVAEGYDCVKYDFFTLNETGNPIPVEDRIGLLGPRYLKMVSARYKAVRDAVGPDVDIIMENHSMPDTCSAIQLGQLCKPMGVFYFEEPNTPDPKTSHIVHHETGLPVASGERIYSRWQYEEFFKTNGLQVIQPDIGTCGGITEAKKICDLAYIYDVGVQVHVCASPLCTAAALQLEAVIPNFVIHEHHVYARAKANKELCIYDYQPKNGKFEIPDLPGLGNEISDLAFKNCDLITIE
ncbi:MAG: mandelate racemase/muconate lactonizing enzyme family protein [Clostridiaceae bacterium]|nr:mandelate racemase/muconate lactonizing enzyme family protein [Clostridiaceae bacterium]